jgi:hypothetical protein
MDSLATAFDAEPNSEEHRRLAESVWLGGAFVEVRYYLGLLLKRNLFRESHSEVDRRLIAFMKTITSREGARLLADDRSWYLAVPLLRFRYESELLGSAKRKPRNVMAVEEFLKDPSITLSALASRVGTTEKQLSRMTELRYARALPRRVQARRELRKSKTSGIARRKHR